MSDEQTCHRCRDEGMLHAGECCDSTTYYAPPPRQEQEQDGEAREPLDYSDQVEAELAKRLYRADRIGQAAREVVRMWCQERSGYSYATMDTAIAALSRALGEKGEEER